MSANLKTTKLNNSKTIPLVSNQAAWAYLTTPGCCWCNNDSLTNNLKFGALYNWYTVNAGKFASKGWHVASADKWDILISILGTDIACGKLKVTGTLSRISPNAMPHETNFSALPGGGRENVNGTFDYMDFIGFFWISTMLDNT